jgi:hypothetical protein
MSDVLDFRIGDEARNDADVRSRLSDILLKTVLGGVIQVDDLYDPQTSKKTKKTAFIVMVSDAGFSAESSPNSIDISASQQQLAFANISYLPENLANGQTALVLTMSDDAHFYQNYIGNMPFNAAAAASAFDAAQFTNPGLALSLQFGLNDPAVLRDVLRQMASSTRANSMVMSLLSPYDHVFNQIGYGQGGMSTGRRGDVIFRNLQNGQFVQPYGQPAVPPPGQNFVPPVPGQCRGQNPKYRTGALWATLNSTSGMRGDDGNSFKFSFTKGGAMVGSEWNLSPSCAIGAVATAYYGNMKEWDDEVTSFDYSAGLYLVAAPFDQFEIRSFAGIGFQTYKMNRYIRNNAVYIGNNPASVFGINDHYDGETQGYSCNFTFEFSRPFTVSPNFVIRPALAIEYQYVQQDGFTEHLIGSDYSWTNSGYNQVNGVQGGTRGTYALQYSDMTFGRFLPRIGISTESHYANGGLQFRAAFLTPLLGERYAQSRQQFVSGSPLFRVRGADLGAGYLQFGGGGHFWIDREHTASIFADGDVYLGSFSTFNVSIGIQQNF